MRYFVECGGPSRRLERRSFVRTCLMRSRLRVCRSESVLCRESFASDARCHPTRLHLPSMSLASICRSLMRYCAESGGPLCLSLDGSGPLSLDQANIDGSALPQSRSPLMAPGLPHSLGASGPLSLALSSGVLPP